MAGTSTDLDAAEFRRDIRATMLMGLPKAAADRPIFYFDTARTWTEETDSSGAPFDFTATPATATTPASVSGVMCAVELIIAAGETIETSVADFSPTKARLTFLDDDWALVDGFSYVTLGGTRYDLDKTIPPIALHDVGVHQVIVQAPSEA